MKVGLKQDIPAVSLLKLMQVDAFMTKFDGTERKSEMKKISLHSDLRK